MKLLVMVGDGIGEEITSSTISVLKAVDRQFQLGLSFNLYSAQRPWEFNKCLQKTRRKIPVQRTCHKTYQRYASGRKEQGLGPGPARPYPKKGHKKDSQGQRQPRYSSQSGKYTDRQP